MDLNRGLLYRQTQQYCGDNHESKVLVNLFGFTKTCFVLVLQGASQNFSTETCFFFNHEPKPLPKLASPIGDENSQNVAYWYKTYIRRNQKKGKKSFGKLQASALGWDYVFMYEVQSKYFDHLVSVQK